MVYKPLLRQDCDKKIKFDKIPLFCYSYKKLKELYPEKDYLLIGDTRAGGKSRDNNDTPCLEIESKRYALFENGSESRLRYRVAGYLPVGKDEYAVLLKSRLPLYLILLFAAVCAAALLCIALLRPEPAPQTPVVPAVDPNVGSIENDTTEKKQSEEGGGAVSLTYSLEAKLDYSTGKIRMYFLNPNASNQDISLVLSLVDGENRIKIAESGLIKAGYGLTEMTFIENSAALSEGLYNAEYTVAFYDSETGERALVESAITDVKLEVEP